MSKSTEKNRLRLGREKTLLIFLCLILPIINCFGISVLYDYEIDGNYVYAGIAPVIGYLTELFNIVSLYAGLAAVTRCIESPGAKYSVGRIIFVCLSYLIQYAAGFVSNLVSTVSAGENIASYLLYSSLNYCFDLLRLLLISVSASYVIRRARRSGAETGNTRKRVIVTAVLSALIFEILASFLTQTLGLLIEYGPPVNISEALTLAEPYIQAAVTAGIGACIMLLTDIYVIGKTNPEAKRNEA